MAGTSPTTCDDESKGDPLYLPIPSRREEQPQFADASTHLSPLTFSCASNESVAESRSDRSGANDPLLPRQSMVQSPKDASTYRLQMNTLEMTNGSVNDPLLSRNSSRSPANVSSWRWHLVLTIIFIVLAILGVCGLAVSQHRGTYPSTPPSRVDKAWACASKLSGPRRSKHDKVMIMTVSWFLTGAGQKIEAPAESECDWSTPFGILYALITIRESLSVHDKSWHSAKPLADGSEVCQWKRIKCDANRNIASLTLNHANITGTIPPELTEGLANLTRLYFYSNDDLKGKLPSEFGNLNQLEEVFMHKTSASGTIPSELGRLTLLNELLLDDTKLSGPMPQEICQLRAAKLNILRANCHENGPVQCDHPTCCTSCRT